MNNSISALSDAALSPNATVHDWIALIQVTCAPTPLIIPFAVEVFTLHCRQGKSFSWAFDRCTQLFLEGVNHEKP